MFAPLKHFLFTEDGRLEEELSYLGRTRQKYSEMKSRHTRSAPGSQPVVPTNANPAKPTQSAPELPVENTFGGGFQVIIQTTEIPNADILTRENLLTHVRMLEEIAQYNVTMFGECV